MICSVSVLCLVCVDGDLVVLFIVLPPGSEPPALGDADRDGVVFLFEQVRADDLVHIPQGGIALGGDHQPLCAAVQPVADSGFEPLLAVGVVLALLLQILGKSIHKVCIPGTVAVA